MAIPVSRRLDFFEIPVVDVGGLVAGNGDPVRRAAYRPAGFGRRSTVCRLSDGYWRKICPVAYTGRS
jgi:hypothetical protein